jgi:hypothetical protein
VSPVIGSGMTAGSVVDEAGRDRRSAGRPEIWAAAAREGGNAQSVRRCSAKGRWRRGAD